MRTRRRMAKYRSICPVTAVLYAVLLTMTPPVLAFGQDPPGSNLANVPIEDLMKIDITSASRKEQHAGDVAAAVFVITHDDILRSGMTTIPDLLRMAPGVDVAQINANKWAVSVRGFNALYANKLLVLVDGRSIYSPIFSGVLWDTEDLMLDDIERIEVIRGPGAAMWGANAVNGVINIVTKAATDTQGALVRVDAGRAGEQGAARYGGTFGTATYRVYSQWSRLDESVIAPSVRADDASHSVTSGFRTDWTRQRGMLTIEGNFTAGQARALWPNLDPPTAASQPLANTPSDTQGAICSAVGPMRGRAVRRFKYSRLWTWRAGRSRLGTTTAVSSAPTFNTTRRSGLIRIWSPGPAIGSAARPSEDESACQ